MTSILEDWKVNKGNAKGRFILCLFRMATIINSNQVLSIVFFWYLIAYRLLVEWGLNVELPWEAKIGRGLRLEHGHGSVVIGSAVIGKNCTLRQLTTIGNKKIREGVYSRSPRIGNNVDIGTNVSIIGDITIGDNVSIGAGSVVVKNVPSNCVVAGNPVRIIKRFYNFSGPEGILTLSSILEQ